MEIDPTTTAKDTLHEALRNHLEKLKNQRRAESDGEGASPPMRIKKEMYQRKAASGGEKGPSLNIMGFYQSLCYHASKFSLAFHTQVSTLNEIDKLIDTIIREIYPIGVGSDAIIDKDERGYFKSSVSWENRVGIKNEEQFNALHGIYEFVENHLKEQERPEDFLDKINYLKIIYNTHKQSCVAHDNKDEAQETPLIKPAATHPETPSPHPEDPPCQSPLGATGSEDNTAPEQGVTTLFISNKTAERVSHRPQAQRAQGAQRVLPL